MSHLLHPDDRKKPDILSGVRPFGVDGCPSAKARRPKETLTLDVPKDASPAFRYATAIRLLITDLKRNRRGNKRCPLENGKRVDKTKEHVFYEFSFTEESYLFEDAGIELDIKGRLIDGVIVSLAKGKIIISVQEDLGGRIEKAALIIDVTVLLEILADRLDQVGRGDIKINRDMADAVIGHKSDPEAPSSIYKEEITVLDRAQQDAYKSALTKSISWIWGPPGCGKTKTLGEIVRGAFDAGKRILICSNTNKALDQVLFNVCEAMTEKHPAMKNGQVIRAGYIADEKLKNEYAEYVDLDRIVARVSEDLEKKKRALENQLDEIRVVLENVGSVLERFRDMDVSRKKVIEVESQIRTIQEKIKNRENETHFVKSRQTDLEHELSRQQKAFMKFFHRPEEKIIMDIQTNEEREINLEEIITSLEKDYDKARLDHTNAESVYERKRKQLEPHDRRALEEKHRKHQEKHDLLASDLQKINDEISDLRAKILAEARVLGATCAKTYISIKDFEKFDLVLVDEASMVLLPMIWLCAGMSRERVVICGDHLQIPPIVESEEKAILEVLKPDIFQVAGVVGDSERLQMLDTQYRMKPEICSLINGPMYGGALKTHALRCNDPSGKLPAPFDQPLTIIDTSDLWPFESQTPFFSRFNLMHTLLVRNLIWHFQSKGEIERSQDFGVCTAYAAQAQLEEKMIVGEGMDHILHAGTIHKYQGDERGTILLDVVESHGGGYGVGHMTRGVPTGDDGAKIFNVAVSRAKNNLIVIANLTYLDQRLPSKALLRSVLHDMQEEGKVIPGNSILELRPVERDLEGLIGKVDIENIKETGAILNEEEFEKCLRQDIDKAEESIIIVSGYVTPGRVAKMGDLLRLKVKQGVKVRCVTRPPHMNGSIPHDQGRESLNALEGIGAVVDCRHAIHQKLCIIDNRIVYIGSINPLSHAGHSEEMMTRFCDVGEYARALISKMTIRHAPMRKTLSMAMEGENPRCADCDGRTVYNTGRFGPYFYCEDKEQCGWKVNLRDVERGMIDKTPTPVNIVCPKCGSPMKHRRGRRGGFYGCSKFPKCEGTRRL